MHGQHTKERTFQIWEMKRQGMKPKEIAAALDVSYSMVSSALYRGRQHGRLASKGRGDIRYQLAQQNVKYGSISDILAALTREQVDWLSDQTLGTGCATLAEYIVEVLRDAHTEETQTETTNA